MASKDVVLVTDDSFWAKVAERVSETMEIDGTPNDIKFLYEAVMQTFGGILNENLEGNDKVTIEDSYLNITATYRAGKGESVGNFGVSVVPGEELKKSVKNDALLDVSDDEDETI